MERIQRALEMARRERAAAAAGGPERPEAVAHVAPPLPGAARDAISVVLPEAKSLAARVVPVDRALLRERRVIFPDGTDPAARAYRMLRTQLLRYARSTKHRMIGVVSCVEGEGKTLTAANLALSIAAEPNQTVLLVDLDLHRPGVAELLGLTVEQGLECWFEESCHSAADLFVRLEGFERLRILPTLRPVAGSSEVLAGPRTRELLAELKARYADRMVVVDLPPCLLADDVLTIAPHLDGVLVVVSEGRTRREDVARMKELLSGVRVLGTVLNVSSESELRSHY